MMSDRDEAIWKALSDKSRRKLLHLLKDGPKTTGALCDAFKDISRFGVMKHLKTLNEAGLDIQKGRGREVWN
ncbi:MAG: helix-turn-helix domain-containing protein [Bdellovibrionota bacterium]